MGSIRYETSAASGYFVDLLRHYGQLGRMLHNGIDIVLFTTPAGDTISAHFIDSALPLYEIRKTLQANASKGIATLFLLWADMMLPYHGQRYRVDDWMEALYSLYGATIYAYDLGEDEIFFFPVFFRGEGLVRAIEHGTAVPFGALTTRRVRTSLKDFVDTWHVADFGGATGTAHDPQTAAVVASTLADSFRLLGVRPDADRDTIKRAYRALARRHHPDLNSGPDAHAQMMALNAAYQQIMGRD